MKSKGRLFRRVVSCVTAAVMLCLGSSSVFAWAKYNNTWVKFFIQVNGVAADTEGNISTRSTSNYTSRVYDYYLKDSSFLYNKYDWKGNYTVTAKCDGYTDEAGTNPRITDDSVIFDAIRMPRPDDAEIFANIKTQFEEGYGSGSTLKYSYLIDSSGAPVPWVMFTTDNYEIKWYVFKGESDAWHVDGYLVKKVTQEVVTVVTPPSKDDIPDAVYSDVSDIDVNEVEEDYENDYAYIFGRTSTEMQPEDGMRRGEAAAVLYRLLKQNGRIAVNFDYNEDAAPIYKDLDGRWDRSALEYMNLVGVYDTQKQYIYPDEYITRGEAFKAMAIALALTDKTDLWRTEYALLMQKAGYVDGDENNELNVNAQITRAEFCKIYNLVIGRDDKSLETADGTTVTPATYGFTDIPDGAWYYEDMLKATSAYTGDYVDLTKRGVRNALDDFGSVSGSTQTTQDESIEPETSGEVADESESPDGDAPSADADTADTNTDATDANTGDTDVTVEDGTDGDTAEEAPTDEAPAEEASADEAPAEETESGEEFVDEDVMVNDEVVPDADEEGMSADDAAADAGE